jgi:hypothetical protein
MNNPRPAWESPGMSSVPCEVARDPVGGPSDDLYDGWAFMQLP